MKLWIGLLGAFLCSEGTIAQDAIGELSRHLGTTPALVVVVTGGAEEDRAAISRLVDSTPWTLYCQSEPSAELESVRDWATGRGLLGERIFVASGGGASLWLAGDLADAVWVLPSVGDPPPRAEMLRVLRPGGLGVASGMTVVKPAPDGVDEWRHPYHGPDNNVVSADRVARLPGELRFQTYPVFAAMPNQTLFAGGRIFFFSGHIAFHEREEPLLNTLTVLNAYNGLKLWSRPLDPDHVAHNVSKVATGTEVVFSEGGKLWLLDAATGAERGQFRAPPVALAAGDTDWKWIAQEGDTLWAAFGPPDGSVAPLRRRALMGHWPWNIADEQSRGLIDNFGPARRLAAFEFPGMKLRWLIDETEAFDARSLCMDRGRIFLLAADRYVAARDATTGDELWRRTPESSMELFAAIGSSLKRQGWGLGWATFACARAGGGVVCLAGPQLPRTVGVDIESGRLLWTSDLESPHPFFYGDDLYLMPRVASTAACQRLEPSTGKVLEELRLGVIGSCTRVTVTPSQFYYRPGGGEGRTVYVDLGTGKLAAYEGIVRPGCFDGVVPANGRLYWMPLACDCWQVHGTFSMAPRAALREPSAPAESPAWDGPASGRPAAPDDWPLFRADSSGTASVATDVPERATLRWTRRVPGGTLSAPTSVGGRVFVSGTDGIVRALDATTGGTLWRSASSAAVLYPPAYWRGRVVFGSCDGALYSLDARNGRTLGRVELAPETRFVPIMDRLMSAWPLGGGVVVSKDGVAYAAAGSTAADGAVVTAVDLATGNVRWRQAYTLDRDEPKLSFGVQSNILLQEGTLYVNGGAPVGIVALDALTGGNPRVVSKLEAGMEMFLEPDGRPSCTGPELYSHGRTRTTIFKRHQGRLYFPMGDRHVAWIDGRLFCSRDSRALDRVVERMNKDPQTGGRMGGLTVPQDPMKVPLEDSILWASGTADVLGLAVARGGLVALHVDRVEGVSADGSSLWTVPLPAAPVRWGLALTGRECLVTLSDGRLLCIDTGS